MHAGENLRFTFVLDFNFPKKMASGLFALLDDIATLMDDVAVMSKVAAKKTAGILGEGEYPYGL